MKKLLTLSTALLFTAGAAFAQSNDAVVTQTGDENDATVEQIGSANSAELNQGFAGQGQDGALGDIFQDGTDNSATLKQRAWGDDDNEHYITQVGASNSATINAFNGDNYGFVEQYGSENSARMDQAGSGHTSIILQTVEQNYAYSRIVTGSDNVTGIVQGIPGIMPGMGGMQLNGLQAPLASTGNAATLKITGSDNEAGILQIGLNNSAGTNPQYSGDKGISIEGDGNTAGIAQLGIGNSANIAVVGSSNMALIGQMGASNSASVMQDGSGNSAVITQSGSGFFPPVID
jgi:hypothetical protein